MPMGALNAAPTFLAMLMKLQMQCNKLAKERALENFASNIFFDDVLLYVHTSKKILEYFRTVMDILKHHHVTLKLKVANGFKTGVSL